MNWYTAIGLAIGLIIGGQIGFFLWDLTGWVIGTVGGGALGAFIGSRIARSRQT